MRLALLGLVLSMAVSCKSGSSDSSEKADPKPKPPPADAAGAVDPEPEPRAPRPPPAPTYEQTRTYRAAIRRGRTLSKKGKHAAAVTAFEEALTQIPGDGRALSELSWTAFKAGQLDKAAKAARDSVAASGDANVKAASLYNLGRVHEARDENEEAIETYLRSFRLRPHDTVGARIEALGAEIPPTDRAIATPLDGPFPDFEAACGEYGDADTSCYPVTNDVEVSGPKAIPEPAEPWLEAAVFFADGAELECRLAVKTEAGWFLTSELFDCISDRADETITRFEATDAIPSADGAEIILEYETADFGADEDPDGAWGSGYVTWKHILVCGMGKSLIPSCAGPFFLGYTATWAAIFDPNGDEIAFEDQKQHTGSFAFEHKLDDRGTLHITQGPRNFNSHPLINAKATYESKKDSMGAYELTFK